MTEARLGIARLGSTRLGDYRPYVFLTVDGVARRLRINGLSIRESSGGAPNTATLSVSEFEPDEGQAIHIGLGALDAAHQVFAGYILKKTRRYEADNPANVVYDLSCISYAWRLNRRTVFARFTSESATTIIESLIADYAPDVTTDHVDGALPSLEEVTFTHESLTDAFDRIADRIGGAWYLDESNDLHFFLTETLTADTIDDSHPYAANVRWERDLGPVRTRVLVEGGGATALAPALPGDPTLAVSDLLWYPDTGGTVVSGPQRITYTGVVAGGVGAQIGEAINPTNGPATAPRATSGLNAGDYRWKFTWVTAAGETLPSPASAVLTLGGAVPAPLSAPAVAKRLGGSLNANGSYKWKYAYLTAAGETLASSESSSLVMTDVAAPTTIGTAQYVAGNSATLYPEADWIYKYTFKNGSFETTPSPASNTYHNTGGRVPSLSRSAVQSPPAGFSRQFYRSKDGGSFLKMTGTSDGWYTDDGSYYHQSNLGPSSGDNHDATVIPGSSTALYRSADVSVIASPDPLVTGIRIYRTLDGGSTFQKVSDLSNTTQTYTDNTADGSLGSTELGTATALYGAADLSGIAVGPATVTSRKVYRTAVGGSTYGLVTTIANNTATTYTDTTADGSLGAAPPGSNTSGLTLTTGEVAAGAPSFPVTSTAFAHLGGGWAFIGSMPIKYSGYTGVTIEGIPPLGEVGSLGTTVKYGVEIVSAPLLVGIPASGDGAIEHGINAGDEVNVLVAEDSLDAQEALTELLTASGEDPADGVIEQYIQDRRLTETEARDRAQAQLALVKDPLVTVQYETFDRHTRAGREVTITSTTLDISGTFKIQSVSILDFDGAQRTFPRRQVVATSRRFTYEALLRQVRG